jgi:hypothetical protein
MYALNAFSPLIKYVKKGDKGKKIRAGKKGFSFYACSFLMELFRFVVPAVGE